MNYLTISFTRCGEHVVIFKQPVKNYEAAYKILVAIRENIEGEVELEATVVDGEGRHFTVL